MDGTLHNVVTFESNMTLVDEENWDMHHDIAIVANKFNFHLKKLV